MNFKPTLLAFAAAAAVLAGPAHALVVTGTTAGAPVFNRPLTTTSLSGVGTAVPYVVLPFTVTLAGSYTFATDSATAGYDPFIALYTAFNPASALTGLLAVNDDLVPGNFTQSGFSFSLAAGTTYNYVTTGFSNLDFGAYTTTITGPGDVVPVPEPSIYLLMALGLAGVAMVARRSRRAG